MEISAERHPSVVERGFGWWLSIFQGNDVFPPAMLQASTRNIKQRVSPWKILLETLEVPTVCRDRLLLRTLEWMLEVLALSFADYFFFGHSTRSLQKEKMHGRAEGEKTPWTMNKFDWCTNYVQKEWSSFLHSSWQWEVSILHLCPTAAGRLL